MTMNTTRRGFIRQAAAALASTYLGTAETRIATASTPAMNSNIASIQSFRAAYPVVADFKFLKGKDGKPPVRETVVVKITDTQGRVGWGQSVPSHTWSYETLESVQTTIDRYLGPALIGLNAFDTETIEVVLNRTIAPGFSIGQPICKAGIDLALFDLTGRILGQTAADRWHRRDKGSDRIAISWTVNVGNLEDAAREVEKAGARGFHNFNLKIGGGVEFDVALCREVRRLAPEAFVWADANGGYDLDTALSVAPKLADIGIAALEQPFPANRLSWYRQLRRQKALPILMDESIVSAVDLEEFHRLGLLDGVAMKVARCGGLAESCRVLEFMENNGLLFFASGLTDPDLSLAACLLLFGAYDLKLPAALNAPQFLSGTILKEPVVIRGDQAHVPKGPGLGSEVDEAKLQELC